MDKRVFLGSGVLNWNRGERIDSRYGSIDLFTSPEQNETITFSVDNEGKIGRLVVVVKENRKSYHIGDESYNVYPSTPEVGEEIVLGTGILFFEVDEIDNVQYVGLKPEDGREYFWMDIRKLYRAHFQTVDLYFEEK